MDELHRQRCFIDVVAVVLADFGEGLDADGQFAPGQERGRQRRCGHGAILEVRRKKITPESGTANFLAGKRQDNLGL